MSRKTKAELEAELAAATATIERLKTQRKDARAKAVAAREQATAEAGRLHQLVLALEER